jgi:hypothetical protein
VQGFGRVFPIVFEGLLDPVAETGVVWEQLGSIPDSAGVGVV